ncbi:MAG: hypothetical protein Q8S19_00750 [Bacillota bacterium]|nr:hypothetical protein [Bacillota bacterium]
MYKLRRIVALVLTLVLSFQSVGQATVRLTLSEANALRQFSNDSLGPSAATNSDHTNPYGTFYSNRRDLSIQVTVT